MESPTGTQAPAPSLHHPLPRRINTADSFHLLPSGLVNPRCVNLIGSGVVFHVPSFFKELAELQEKGLDTKDRILVSDRCQVNFDLHAAVDGLEEVEVGCRPDRILAQNTDTG